MRASRGTCDGKTPVAQAGWAPFQWRRRRQRASVAAAAPPDCSAGSQQPSLGTSARLVESNARSDQIRAPERGGASTPNGIRTRATAVKGRGPGPLDDGGRDGRDCRGSLSWARQRCGSLRGARAGSSVGTSVRLKSGRSAVRPRPCPRATDAPTGSPAGASPVTGRRFRALRVRAPTPPRPRRRRQRLRGARHALPVRRLRRRHGRRRAGDHGRTRARAEGGRHPLPRGPRDRRHHRRGGRGGDARLRRHLAGLRGPAAAPAGARVRGGRPAHGSAHRARDRRPAADVPERARRRARSAEGAVRRAVRRAQRDDHRHPHPLGAGRLRAPQPLQRDHLRLPRAHLRRGGRRHHHRRRACAPRPGAVDPHPRHQPARQRQRPALPHVVQPQPRPRPGLLPHRHRHEEHDAGGAPPGAAWSGSSTGSRCTPRA